MSNSGARLDLVAAVLRATKLTALVTTSVIGVAFLVLPLVFGLRNSLRDLDVGVIYHLSLIVSLAGAGFVLDDRAHETLAVTTIGRARVAVIRMLAGLAALAPVWWLQLWLVPQLIDTDRHIPTLGLAIEGPILAICIWAVGSVFAARFDGQASSVAVPAALIGCALIFFLPAPISLFENPASDRFAASRLRFLVLGVLGVAALTYSLRTKNFFAPGPRVGGPGRRVKLRTAGQTRTRS